MRRIIKNIAEFSDFEKPWESFRTRISPEIFCVSWLWLFTWCRYYLKPEDKLHIHIYYDESEIIGIFPVYLKKISFGYQLRFIASGENQDAEVCSEFQDFILDPENKIKLLTLFTKDVFAENNIISCAFDNIINGSDIQLWANRFLFSWKKTINIVGCQYLMSLNEKFLNQVDAFKSKTAKRQAKQYFTNENCTCEYLTDASSLDVFFTDLVKLHNHSWNERGQRGVFENKKFFEFHYQLATRLQQNNKLVMFRVCSNKVPLAVFYGFIDGNTLSYYQSGILRSKELLSAGIAMHTEALIFAQKNMLKHYDLMKGKADSYKQRIVRGDKLVLSVLAFKKQYAWLPYYWKLSKYLLSVKRDK